MATQTLPAPASVGPSDADLLNTTASLLDAMPGPRLTQPLSDLLGYVCSEAAPEGRARAARLEAVLAGHLVDGGALRLHVGTPVEPALDAWASKVLIRSVRVRLSGCARCSCCTGGVR